MNVSLDISEAQFCNYRLSWKVVCEMTTKGAAATKPSYLDVAMYTPEMHYIALAGVLVHLRADCASLNTCWRKRAHQDRQDGREKIQGARSVKWEH